MFSRSQRIPSVLFDEILNKGVSFRSASFLLVVLRGGSNTVAKISVIAPKKVALGAVKRNRLRRQARAWVKTYTTKQLRPGVGMILFIKTGWVGPFPASFQEELKNLFSKAGIMV